MWGKVTETEPPAGEFYRTKIDPIRHEQDQEVIYRHPVLGWMQPGVWNKVLFEPTHYWKDEKPTEKL